MSSLKGQYVYAVCEYDKDGVVQGFNLYADLNEAKKAIDAIERKVKKYGGFADYDRTVII